MSKTMGQYIKELRTSEGLSQEELGKMLTPPVNRAAVNKWETGQVENIKRNHIQQLAKHFGISPAKLMCFEDSDDQSDRPTYYSDQDTADLAQAIYDSRELRLLFDAAKDAKAEDLEFTYEMLMRLKKKEDHDDDDAC